jgi:mRNA-degrading endonuclease RelE of RelBE toxin-antitoxin system
MSGSSKCRFIYSGQAEKFLARNRSSIDYERVEAGLKLAANKLLLNEKNNADVKKMEGEWKGYYRLRLSTFRVVFNLIESDPVVLVIEEIERRGNVY